MGNGLRAGLKAWMFGRQVARALKLTVWLKRYDPAQDLLHFDRDVLRTNEHCNSQRLNLQLG